MVGMPQDVRTRKRERQYRHIKKGLLERGRSEAEAEEIAARTVNKERGRPGGPSINSMNKAQLRRAVHRQSGR